MNTCWIHPKLLKLSAGNSGQPATRLAFGCSADFYKMNESCHTQYILSILSLFYKSNQCYERIFKTFESNINWRCYLLIWMELDMTIETEREVMCVPTIIWVEIGQQPGYFNKSLSYLHRETFELMSPSPHNSKCKTTFCLSACRKMQQHATIENAKLSSINRSIAIIFTWPRLQFQSVSNKTVPHWLNV